MRQWQYRLCMCVLALMACTWNVSLEAAKYANQPKGSIDKFGNAVAVWEGYNSQGDHFIQSSIKAADGNWATATQISTLGQYATNPVFASDSFGNCVVVWTAFDTNSHNNVLFGAMKSSVSTTWSTPAQISTSNTNVLDDYQVSIADGSLSDPILVLWSANIKQNKKPAVFASTTTFTTFSASWSTQVMLGGGDNGNGGG